MKRIFIYLLFSITSLYALEVEKIGLPVSEKYRNCISSGQGLRDVITFETWKGMSETSAYHYAIDFVIPEFTEVYAVKDGVVKDCYPSFLNGDIWNGHPTLGGLIIIEHTDGTFSLYGHLSKTNFCEGENVTKGQCIGLSGGNPKKKCSGVSTNAHLHFAFMIDIAKFIITEGEE